MSHVLVICHDLVGPRMAGPAIRLWELARVLAGKVHVTLAVPGGTTIRPDGFDLLPFASGDPKHCLALELTARTQTDVVVASGHLVQQLPFLRDLSVPLVADAYIPLPVESLAWHAPSDRPRKLAAYRSSWQAAQLIAQHADFLLVASERQRDFWLGVLAACGRLHPDAYSEDNDLRNLVDTVPVGCRAEPPRPGPAMKGVWAGIGVQSRVILWGGGLWNWFDPLTLLRAMPHVVARHPDARLVFTGADHPDAGRVPEMAIAQQARALSDEMGMTGRTVFWGNWVPYADRGAYLLEADVGVALHRAGLEPHFAFRSRLLDSIWAGLPMVLTKGDVVGEELERRSLGVAVPPYGVEEVERALAALLDNPDTRQNHKASFDELRTIYRWERVAAPLVRFCSAPRLDPSKAQAIALARAGDGGERAAGDAEIARLQKLVQGYESGRFMRLMAALRRRRRSPK